MTTLTYQEASLASTPGLNRLARSVAKLERVPAFLRPWLRNRVLGRAETATGMVVGMNVRDDCHALAKTLHIDYKRRTQDGLRAVARLSAAQRELMLKNDKGEQPIQCEFIWAWISTAKSHDIAKNRVGPVAAVYPRALSRSEKEFL